MVSWSRCMAPGRLALRLAAPLVCQDCCFTTLCLLPTTKPCAPPLLMQIRAALKRKKAGKYGARVGAVQKRQKYESEHPLPVDELESAFDE